MMTTGCNFDFVDKVSGSPCTTDAGQAGLLIVPSRSLINPVFRCVPFDDTNATFAIRCCADEVAPHVVRSQKSCEELGFSAASVEARPGICGESDINGTCTKDVNFTTAKDICEGVGSRLCTYGELVSGAALNSGYVSLTSAGVWGGRSSSFVCVFSCLFNNEFVWSADKCDRCNQESRYVHSYAPLGAKGYGERGCRRQTQTAAGG